jgi:anti-anti-sigma factor
MVRPWTAGEHIFLSYQNHDERSALLTINFTDALESGKKFIYLAESSSADDVVAWLGDQGLDVGPVLAREQFVIHPAERFVSTTGTFDSDQVIALVTRESREATRAGYTGVRVCSEMAWALRAPANLDQVLAQERRLTDLLASGELTGLKLVCLYAHNHIPTSHLTALQRAHSHALTAAQAQHLSPLLRVDQLEGSAGLCLSGDVDKSNIAELSAALESAFRENRDFHVCLVDVHYVDVAAVRLLAQTARKVTNGYRFVLRSPGPLIRAILRIYGWDKLPSLQMSEGF